MDAATYIHVATSIQRVLASAATETFRYSQWSDNTCRKSIAYTISDLKRSYADYLPLPIPMMLDAQQLKQTGFLQYNGELYLLPHWLIEFTDPEVDLEELSFSGASRSRKLKNCDDEARNGSIAFGFRPIAGTPSDIKAN